MPIRPEPCSVVGWGSVSPLGADQNPSGRRCKRASPGFQAWMTIGPPIYRCRLQAESPMPSTACPRCGPPLRPLRPAALVTTRRPGRWPPLGWMASPRSASRWCWEPASVDSPPYQQHATHKRGTGPGQSVDRADADPRCPAGRVAIDLGLKGGAHTPVSACASGAEALMLAQMLLNDDRADLVLAGGAKRP